MGQTGCHTLLTTFLGLGLSTYILVYYTTGIPPDQQYQHLHPALPSVLDLWISADLDILPHDGPHYSPLPDSFIQLVDNGNPDQRPQHQYYSQITLNDRCCGKMKVEGDDKDLGIC